MNQIRDIGVPEKMRRHMKIQSIVDALVRSASLTKLRRNGVMDFLAIDAGEPDGIRSECVRFSGVLG